MCSNLLFFVLCPHTTNALLSLDFSLSRNLLNAGSFQNINSNDTVENLHRLVMTAKQQEEMVEIKKWQEVVHGTIEALKQTKSESVWPRDLLFNYFQLMGRLQNNMKEFQHLQHLGAAALHNVVDS